MPYSNGPFGETYAKPLVVIPCFIVANLSFVVNLMLPVSLNYSMWFELNLYCLVCSFIFNCFKICVLSI